MPKADDQAVARGDLSETIEVEASGEIAELKTTVNGMVSFATFVGRYKADGAGHVTSNTSR